jgi:hypothetical protein
VLPRRQPHPAPTKAAWAPDDDGDDDSLTLRLARRQSAIMAKINVKAQGLYSLGLYSLTCALLACHPYRETALRSVRENRGDLQECIGEAAQRGSTALRGTMELRLEISPSGTVHRFIFTRDEIKDPQFSDCIKNRAIQWHLPPPPSGKLELFSYKFNVGMK